MAAIGLGIHLTLLKQNTPRLQNQSFDAAEMNKEDMKMNEMTEGKFKLTRECLRKVNRTLAR